MEEHRRLVLPSTWSCNQTGQDFRQPSPPQWRLVLWLCANQSTLLQALAGAGGEDTVAFGFRVFLSKSGVMPRPALRTTPPAQVEAIISRRDCFLRSHRCLRCLLSHGFVLGCAGRQQQSHHQALSNGSHGAERLLCLSTDLRTQMPWTLSEFNFKHAWVAGYPCTNHCYITEGQKDPTMQIRSKTLTAIWCHRRLWHMRWSPSQKTPRQAFAQQARKRSSSAIYPKTNTCLHISQQAKTMKASLTKRAALRPASIWLIIRGGNLWHKHY